MTSCKYYDCGFCYAPDDVETSASPQSACFDPDYCLYLKSQMTEIEKVKSEIKVLEKKLALLEELEKTKSPVEEAYKNWWGEYPGTEIWTDYDETRWVGFKAGYEFAYAISTAKEVMEEVQEEQEYNWKPKPQNENEVAEGLKKAFREAVEQGVIPPVEKKQKTLTDLIERWWCDVFTTHSDWDMETSIDDLVDRIQLWLPKEQSAKGSQNEYVECSVDGFNDCLNKIKGNLR